MFENLAFIEVTRADGYKTLVPIPTIAGIDGNVGFTEIRFRSGCQALRVSDTETSSKTQITDKWDAAIAAVTGA